MSALTAISVGTAAYGAYSKYKQSKANQGMMMEPGNIMAPEDKFAPKARQETYDYMSKMMGDVGRGVDPMQTRRDAQMQHEMAGARRDMYGDEGNRNQSTSGMGMQRMSLYGSNPAQMLAAGKRDKTDLQWQMDDIRNRINTKGTDYMQDISKFAPQMMNKIRTGAETTGSYGPQFIPGADTGEGMDMDGIAGMAESFLGNSTVQKGIGTAAGWMKGTGSGKVGYPQQGGTPNGFTPFQGNSGYKGSTMPTGYTGSRTTFDEAGNPMSG